MGSEPLVDPQRGRDGQTTDFTDFTDGRGHRERLKQKGVLQRPPLHASGTPALRHIPWCDDCHQASATNEAERENRHYSAAWTLGHKKPGMVRCSAIDYRLSAIP